MQISHLPRFIFHTRLHFSHPSYSSSAQMAQALWNGVVIATTPSFETVDGNVYFPPESLKKEYFKPTSTKTTCGWKGVASYYTVDVNGKENKDAAWYYAEPKAAANNIKNHVAFWKGVEVKKS